MTKLIQILIVCIFCQSMIGQINSNNEINADNKQIPERSEALNLLYEQATYIENNSTPLEIEQNRLAVKKEWAKISPEIADLYKPIEVNLTEEELKKFTPQKDVTHSNPLPSNRNWGDDLLIHDDLISGIDMEVSATGDIYVLGYYDDLNAANGATIYIYKSTDNGASFSLLSIATTTAQFAKMQLVLLEPDQYLIVNVLTETGVFGVYRWDLNTQDLEFQVIATGVSDFSVDRNFPANTNNVRVFATYLKPDGGGCTNRVFSARSTSGSFGFDWVDETLISTICSERLDFTYGLSGAIYTAFVSTTTGNMYVQTNTSYNDPASWSPVETITNGANIQIGGLSISATRKALASDKVILFASFRTAGSADDFDMFSFRRENANPFVIFDLFGISNNGTDILFPDSWIRKEIGAEVIRLSYIIYEGLSRTLRTKTYDGSTLGSAETISDVDEVFKSTAIAETQDQSPCLAFSHYTVVDGENIYFDSDYVLGLEDTAFYNFQYYPNPASEILAIKASQIIDKVELYTISGKKVKEFTPNMIEVDLSIDNLTSGIYIMTVHSNEQTANYKLIKN